MNSMIRWSPWREMRALQRTAQRIADGQSVESAWPGRAPLGATLTDPAVDMYETDGKVVITVATPGLAPEDLDIKLVGDTLTIKGEVKHEQERQERRYIYRERRLGSFMRTFTLPDIVGDQVTAEMQHGVLTLTLPKAQTSRTHTVTVQLK